jgi:glycosyltransferase involved in cell wall biosynthesis
MPARYDLSIIIPHLDAPDALARCLHALAEQRNGDVSFEVIVVDNGSRLRPDAVCAAYDFVRLIDEATPGPGPARSTGAREASAGLLAFIDCDCIALTGWVACILDHFSSHPETGIIGGDVRIALTNPKRPTAIEAYESVYGYRMQIYIERDHYTATCNMAVRRTVFMEVGDFAGIRIAEDVDWGRRATALGIRIDYVAKMQIETPARDNFAELTRKWDRHIGHDFAEVSGIRGHLAWILRALALAASPVAELPRIARSARVTGLLARGLAFLCLTRIRLYRAQHMLGRLFSQNDLAASEAWRQPD